MSIDTMLEDTQTLESLENLRQEMHTSGKVIMGDDRGEDCWTNSVELFIRFLIKNTKQKVWVGRIAGLCGEYPQVIFSTRPIMPFSGSIVGGQIATIHQGSITYMEK